MPVRVLLRLCGSVSFFGGIIGGIYIAVIDFAGPAIGYFLASFSSASIRGGTELFALGIIHLFLVIPAFFLIWLAGVVGMFVFFVLSGLFRK